MPNNQSLIDIKPENQSLEKTSSIIVTTPTLWSDTKVTWSDSIGVWGGSDNIQGGQPRNIMDVDIKPVNQGVTNL